MPDYEVLVDAGNSGLQREFVYESALIDADLGDGYYAAAVIGEVTGVLRYTLTWKQAHRDIALIQGRTYNLVNVGSLVPRVRYLEEFVYRRIINGNDPFWFSDPNNRVYGARRLVICRLLEKRLIQTQDTRNSLLYSYTLKFQQIRGAAAQT